jgi:membrane fusion protein (multidrug efflux system)
MIRKYLLAIVIVALVVGTLGGTKVLQIQALIAAGKAYVPPPESVSTAVAESQQWQATLSAIASVTAVQGVIVTPDIPGTVKEISFESGAMVNRNDVLVRLDTSAEEAQLKAILAQVDLAKVNLERVRSLRQQQMISQAELDTAEATLKQNEANADAVRATIEKKIIRAPFAGKLGIRQVNLGQYLENGKPVVSLQSLDPVYVNFSMPQQELPKLKVGMAVHVTVDAYPERRFEGKLSAINPDLNASTRSVGLQATFDNPEKLLRPGMFARAEVVLPEAQDVVVIPSTSLLSATYGDSVFIVEPATNGTGGLIVRQKFVRPGKARGDFISVDSGLKAGEKVVSAGAFKLRNGMTVVENNDLKPESRSAPQPTDS